MLHSELIQIIHEHFGLTALKLTKINGYENQNFTINTKNKKYILKTYLYDSILKEELDAESQILEKLIGNISIQSPVPVKTNKNTYLYVHHTEKQSYLIRIVSFLEGTFLGEITCEASVSYDLGIAMSKLNLELKKHHFSSLRAKKSKWDLAHFDLNKPLLKFVENESLKSRIKYFFTKYDTEVRPTLTALTPQLIHGDANEWNLLSDGSSIKGIIDFGDMCQSYRICDIAICITYLCYDKRHPLEWMSDFLKAYHSNDPLTAKEIHILYYLVAARLCTSLCNSARSRHLDPENVYASSSQKNAERLLNLWFKYNPILIQNMALEAIGLKTLDSEIDAEKILNKRSLFFVKNLSLSYSEPINMKSAAFQYMYGLKGETYLDAYNNIPHVGHSHPLISEAIYKQQSTLNTNTRYLYHQLGDYAEKLLSKFPEKLCKVFFVNSGSAASDLAIRIAQAYNKRKKVLVMEHGYHGNTKIGIDISHYKYANKKGPGRQEHITKTDIPDTYRGEFTQENAGHKYAQKTIQLLSGVENEVSCFISEPIVGCGGQVPLAPGYLKELYPHLKAKGIVCISDEVQTGFGRLGFDFWGFEYHGVIPDMVILGKPMGNGHPLGAVVCSAELAEEFSKGVEFFSSFGGNPVSCAVGSAVLDIIEKEQLQNNAFLVGDYYKNELIKLSKDHPCIGNVRGSGLFLGIDLVHPNTNHTFYNLAQHVKNSFRKNHILISTDGPDDSVLKTKPPLCFNTENVDQVVTELNRALERFDYNKSSH